MYDDNSKLHSTYNNVDILIDENKHLMSYISRFKYYWHSIYSKND